MYTHRDKRFYATIVQDSCEYYGELVTMHKTGNLQRCSLGEAPGTAEMGSTNYLWRKGVYINDWRIFVDVPTDYHYVIFRYGRALLNKAEALLCLAKSDPSKLSEAVATFNQTRTVHGGLPESEASTLVEAWKDYKIERHVELPMEEKGIVATRDKAKERGDEWQIGETLSAAIGQSYNSYTPIQMAKYISMLANGGEPIDVTIVKSINDVNGNQVSKEDITKFVNAKLGLTKEKKENLNIKKENIDAILKGMKGVTSEEGGTAYSTFANFNIELGGKTGSAQTDVQGKINGWFVGFAPYEEPEIAVVVLVENAGSGSYTAEVARDIIAQYFGMNTNQVTENTTAIPTVQIIN